MNRKEAKEILPVIMAFIEGKDIECLYKTGWEIVKDTIVLDYPNVSYRIKPNPKLVPFTFEDNLLFRDKWICLKKNDFNRYLKIVSYESDVVSIKNQSLSYDVLLKDYTFEDGSPCGKYINE